MSFFLVFFFANVILVFTCKTSSVSILLKTELGGPSSLHGPDATDGLQRFSFTTGRSRMG